MKESIYSLKTTAIIILFSLFVVSVVDMAARSRRLFLENGVIKITATVSEPYTLWQENGVRGRVLVHFDRDIRADNTSPDDPGITAENFLYRGVRSNFIRKIYHVIPDHEWVVASANLTAMGSEKEGDIFHLQLEGTPIYVLRQRDIPSFGEKILVNVNTASWTSELMAEAAMTLQRKGIKSDIVTVYGSESESVQRRLVSLQ